MSDKPLPGRTVSESRVQLSQFMGPADANALGNVHGGVIMKLVDEAGALAAMRHARSAVVTVAVDSMTFLEPILVGQVVTIRADLTLSGTTSMETKVEVVAENPVTGQKSHTNTAYLVYVAIDSEGRPRLVPPLIPQTPQEKAEMAAAQERQAYRKSQRAKKNQ